MGKRKRRNRIIAAIIRFILFVIVAVVTLVVVYVLKISSTTGSWVRKIDITDEITANAVIWMSSIEDADINSEWIQSHGDTFEVKAVLKMDKSKFGAGHYQIYIDDESYKECEKKAKVMLSACMEDVIARKLQEAGYKDTVTNVQSQAAILNVLGCSMEEYLQQNEISVMVPYNDLNNRVNEEGDYLVNAQYITFNHDGLNIEERYIQSGDKLILTEGAYVYSKTK